MDNFDVVEKLINEEIKKYNRSQLELELQIKSYEFAPKALKPHGLYHACTMIVSDGFFATNEKQIDCFLKKIYKKNILIRWPFEKKKNEYIHMLSAVLLKNYIGLYE